MNDEQTGVVIEAVLNLAVTMRDEIGQGVTDAARAVLDAAGGDAIAALTVAAALVRVDQPLDVWWQQDHVPSVVAIEDLIRKAAALKPRLAPCGTHSAYTRHRARGEEPDMACRLGERVYQRERNLRLKARRSA